MEMLVDTGMIRQRRVSSLQTEAGELCAIIVASRNTARKNLRSQTEGQKKAKAEHLTVATSVPGVPGVPGVSQLSCATARGE